MPGSYGFAGQRADAVSGLDDDVARSYDPAAGQFVSADTVLPGNGYDRITLLADFRVNGSMLWRGGYTAGGEEQWDLSAW